MAMAHSDNMHLGSHLQAPQSSGQSAVRDAIRLQSFEGSHVLRDGVDGTQGADQDSFE